MNQIDTSGNWEISGGVLLGGDPASMYGLIIVTTPDGVKVLQHGLQVVPRSSQIVLSTGSHQVVFRHIGTGCVDTAFAQVVCLSACRS